MTRKTLPIVILAVLLLTLLIIPKGSEAATSEQTSGVAVTFGPLTYSPDYRTADVLLTVKNTGVSAGIAGGRFYFVRQRDGNKHDVTLLGVLHQELPVPLPEDPATSSTRGRGILTIR